MVKIKKKGQSTKERQVQGFEVLMHKASDLVTEYQKQLVMAATAVVLIIVIASGYSFVRSQGERKAAPLFAAAYEYYSPFGGASADFQKALGLFREIQRQYPGTKSGAMSQYYIGNCLVNLGKYDEALKEYETFAGKYGSEKVMLAMVHQRMGYVYNALGKKAEAVKAFEQAETIGGAGIATIELAHLYESEGNVVEAQKKYKLAMDELAGTPLGVEAMGKIQKIAPIPQPTEEEPSQQAEPKTDMKKEPEKKK